MGFRPTTGEKIAYFVVVVVLIASILSGTYYLLRHRNKRIQSQLSPSIRLTRQDKAAQTAQDPETAQGFEKTSMHQRSTSRGTGNDFTAEWAREQARTAARGETRPLTIYPESSISSAPWQFPTHQEQEQEPKPPPRGRQLSTRTHHRTRSPIRSISPLTRRLQASTRHLAQWPPRSDSLNHTPAITRPRPSHAPQPPLPDPTIILTPFPPPPPTSPPHQIYTLHLNRPRLAHAPSHYSAASPDRALYHNTPDTFSNPHRGTPSPSPFPYHPSPPTFPYHQPPSPSHHALPTTRRHTSPSPSPSPPSSPHPSSAATDIARCVNPYYLSATLARRAARVPTSRRARWSVFGLGSDVGTESEVGVGVRGRGAGGEGLVAPLRGGSGRDGGVEKGRNRVRDGADEKGRGEREVRREVAEIRVHAANEVERDGARREEFLVPVRDGGMF